jgi:hypothetical protein
LRARRTLEDVQNDKWLELQAALDKGKEMGVCESVVAACYSHVFEQLVVVGVYHAFIFDMPSGKQVFRFQISANTPVTCGCLDAAQRRLMTGAHDGTVRSWCVCYVRAMYLYSSS